MVQEDKSKAKVQVLRAASQSNQDQTGIGYSFPMMMLKKSYKALGRKIGKTWFVLKKILPPSTKNRLGELKLKMRWQSD